MTEKTICHNCGNVCKKYNICPHCGHFTPKLPAKTDVWYCEHCGHGCSKSNFVCPVCGHGTRPKEL